MVWPCFTPKGVLASEHMGIEVTYRRLSKSEFDRIQGDPEEGMEFILSDIAGFDADALMELAGNPEAIRAKGPEILAAFEKQREDPTRVDLDKDWHALHFLLTGDDSMEPEHCEDDPLHNVVMGGHPTNIELDYGPARFFNAEDIGPIAEALSRISVDDLRARFSAEAFNETEIYPNPRPGGWTIEEIEGLLHVYPKLVKFFQEAAASGEIVMVYAT
jgi:hypothetical protein